MDNGRGMRGELAAFLRSRRLRMRPEDVGIAVRGRRRTTGLRREEVADMAGIGVTWYTWLEQGRNVRPSQNVESALADALRLTGPERVHLHNLIHNDERPRQFSPTGQFEVLASHLQSPAYVRDSAGDLVSTNASARSFFGNFGPSFKGKTNFLIYLFMNEEARWVLKDWHEVADRSVAQYRRTNGGSPPNSRAAIVIDHLNEHSPEFRRAWDAFLLPAFFVGHRILRDHLGNETSFNYATLTSPNAVTPLLSVYFPMTHAVDPFRHAGVKKEHPRARKTKTPIR